jgi:hypothetical protein
VQHAASGSNEQLHPLHVLIDALRTNIPGHKAKDVPMLVQAGDRGLDDRLLFDSTCGSVTVAARE